MEIIEWNKTLNKIDLIDAIYRWGERKQAGDYTIEKKEEIRQMMDMLYSWGKLSEKEIESITKVLRFSKKEMKNFHPTFEFDWKE